MTPPPMVASDVDLTAYPCMLLDVRRLRDSRLAVTASGDEFRAAVLLWCAAWHQRPAASLPDDDVELAQLAGFGRVVKEWMKIRGGALHGWIKCSDGRLYHPVVAEKANELWDDKLEKDWKRECDRVRKENLRREKSGEPALPLPPRPTRNSVVGGDGIPEGRPDHSDGIPAESPPRSDGIPEEGAAPSDGHPTETPQTSAGIPTESALKGKEKNRKEKNNKKEQGSEPNGSGGSPPSTSQFIFAKGRELLGKAQAPPREPGALIGKWLRDHGEDAVLLALKACETKQTPEPVAFITATLQHRRGGSQSDDDVYRGVE